MATDNPRIGELRRRIQQDPASIAFAPLAEELRRAGDCYEAVQVCLAGLEHHPTFLSARVTLGRALMELEQYQEARAEFEYVLKAAPDNLIAARCMSELELKASEAAAHPNPALAALEEWLARIEADRTDRDGGSGLPDAPSGAAAGSAPRTPPL